MENLYTISTQILYNIFLFDDVDDDDVLEYHQKHIVRDDICRKISKLLLLLPFVQKSLSPARLLLTLSFSKKYVVFSCLGTGANSGLKIDSLYNRASIQSIIGKAD